MAETSLYMMHEIYLDFSIKNAGFFFVVEIWNFSVFVYNFYSSIKYIVELTFVCVFVGSGVHAFSKLYVNTDC